MNPGMNNLVAQTVSLFPYPDVKEKETDPFLFEGVKGTSQSFRQVLETTEQVANSDVNVHIYGETGTGKELIAHSIHMNSARADGPFIPLNCGAVPPTLIESELFGYQAGAFTGAKSGGYKGKIVQANQGTLFLDEVGDIHPAMQVALLRVLQEKQVYPIGGSKPVPVDIRVVTATNQNLQELVRKGKFREDLFYRIFVFPIDIPPLRERRQDIVDLACYYCEKIGWHVQLTDTFFDVLFAYEWPGNVRELFNFLDRVKILFPDHVPDSKREIEKLLFFQQERGGKRPVKPIPFRDKVEKEKIVSMLKQTEGNVTMASRNLHIPRSTFYRKLKKYELL